jgi:ssDNA-binding Zn-finger/Zn-ribbon topoisomerase 1
MAGLPSIGYTFLLVKCPECGHEAKCRPGREKDGKFFVCSKCHCRETIERRFKKQLIYAGGEKPPDNVTRIKNRKRDSRAR